MEAERQRVEEVTFNQTDVREFEHSNAIPGVYFTCDLFDDDIYLPRNEMYEQIEVFLREKLDMDGVSVGAIMIHTLNESKSRDDAISTLNRILKNIQANPGEEKYRRVKTTSVVFSVRFSLKIDY